MLLEVFWSRKVDFTSNRAGRNFASRGSLSEQPQDIFSFDAFIELYTLASLLFRFLLFDIMVQTSGEPRPSGATLIELEKPEKLQTLLKQEGVGDCLSCRLVGT